MRLALAALVSFALVAPAYADTAPQPQEPKKRVVMHYPTLEKMLRRFSSQAGEARTRG
jgi:hypothetical protein